MSRYGYFEVFQSPLDFEITKVDCTSTWRYDILIEQHNVGIKVRLPQFIKSFLENRSIRVCAGSTVSELYAPE